MWVEIKRILRHSFVYGLAILLTNIMSLILLPVYMSYLEPDEIGLLEIINRTSDILRIILMVGLTVTILRFSQESDDEIHKKTVISTALLFLAFFSCLILGMLMIFAGQVNRLMFACGEHTGYIRIMLITLFFEVIYIVPILYFQARLQSTIYILLSVIRFTAGVSLIIYFVAYKQMGIMGVLYGNLMHIGLLGSILFIWMIVKVGIRFDRKLLRSMLKFGLPFVPGSIFLFILNSGDRYLLINMTSAEKLGVYAIGYRIGSIAVALVISPFMRVWSASYVKYSQKSNRDYIFGNILTYVIFVYTQCSLAVILFRHELLVLLGDVVYWEAADIVPYIALAYLFWAGSLILDSGFYITKKTGYKPILLGIAAAIAIGLCLLLIPYFGYYGALYATVISFLCYFVISLVILRKIYPIMYQWGRLLKIVLAALMILGANELLISEKSILAMIAPGWKEWYFCMVWKGFLLILLPVLLFLGNFFTREEKDKFRQFLGIT